MKKRKSSNSRKRKPQLRRAKERYSNEDVVRIVGNIHRLIALIDNNVDEIKRVLAGKTPYETPPYEPHERGPLATMTELNSLAKP